MSADQRFLKGLELFNRKEYFECHEVIEELWLETPSDDKYRDLYKGVIQAAAAIYQFDRGILSGALSLYETAVAYLDLYRPCAFGLNVDRLIGDLEVCFKELETWDGKSKMKRNEKLIPVLEYGV